MSTTLAALRRLVGASMGLYYNGTFTSGSQTVGVDNIGLKSSLKGSQEYVGQYLYRPAAAAAADMTRRIYQYDPVTGTVTPDAAWTNAAAAAEAYEIYRYMHPTRELADCINSGLARCFYRFWDILTLLSDGNCDSSATTAWTGTDTTLSKVTSGAARGPYSLRAANTAANGLGYQAVTVRSGSSYFLSAYCRVISGTSVTATLELYDATNAAVLASDTHTGANWERLTCAYQTPSTCKQVQVRLKGSALNSTVEWDDVVLLPYGVDEIALPSWVTETAYVDDVYEAMGDYLYQDTPLRPWGWWKVVNSRDAVTPFTLRLSPRPNGHPILIEGVRPYAAMATDAATTVCADDLSIMAAKCEAYKWLMASGPMAETTRFEKLWSYAERDFREKARQFQPSFQRRPRLSEPF